MSRGAEVPVLWKAEDVAAFLGVSRDSVYQMVSRGQIPGVVHIGRRLRFDRQTVLDWIRHAPSSSGARR